MTMLEGGGGDELPIELEDDLPLTSAPPPATSKDDVPEEDGVGHLEESAKARKERLRALKAKLLGAAAGKEEEEGGKGKDKGTLPK